MKKLISFTGLLIFFLILISSGCKKDEEVNLLIGTWNVSQFSQVTYLNGVKQEGSESIDLLDPGDMDLMIFDDGTGEAWQADTLNRSFTWVQNGETLTVTLAPSGVEPQMVMPMTYTVTNTTLLLIGSITSTGESGTYVYTQTIIADRATD
jgi:hypothetical protein